MDCCKLLDAADTERLLTALHQGDDRTVTRLLGERGICRAGTYDIEIDPRTGTSRIVAAEKLPHG
jgi:hypothetical protein